MGCSFSGDIGVLIQILAFGQIPIIALSLAFSFSIYGLNRKKVSVDAQTGLMIETLFLLTPALVYLMLFSKLGTSVTLYSSYQMFLLLLAGPVTSVPLLLFNAAAQRLNYSTMGFFQYIAPSIMFLCAIFLYGEPFSMNQAITFAFIWSSLLLLSAEALVMQRQPKAKAAN